MPHAGAYDLTRADSIRVLLGAAVPRIFEYVLRGFKQASELDRTADADQVIPSATHDEDRHERRLQVL